MSTDLAPTESAVTNTVTGIVNRAQDNPSLLTILVLAIIGIVCMWFWVKFIAPQRQQLEDKRVKIEESKAAEAASMAQVASSMAQVAQTTENAARLQSAMLPQIVVALEKANELVTRLTAASKA